MLTAIIAFHALAGGVERMAVLCLGGGHEHALFESDHCESACGHDGTWPLPVPVNEHEDNCGCTDIELTIAELISVPRGGDVDDPIPAIVPIPAWGVVVQNAGLGRRGPPQPRPWFDPGGVHRLAIVASVRLIL